MSEDEGYTFLGVEMTTLLLRFGTRRLDGAEDPFSLAQRASQFLKAPPGAAIDVLKKLNGGAQESDFTATEVRFIHSVRRFAEAAEELKGIRREFPGKVKSWAEENAALLEKSIAQAVDGQLRDQHSGVMMLTDREVRQIRALVARHVPYLVQAFVAELANAGNIEVQGELNDVADALLTRAVPDSQLESLRAIVAGGSRGLLLLSIAEAGANLLPDKEALYPLARHLMKVRTIEAHLPQLEQEMEAAFEALEAAAALDRWDSAARKP